MKRIILLNIIFFCLLVAVFLVAAFVMGYAAHNRFGTDAGILYLLIVTLHLFLNYLVMHKRENVTTTKILYVSAVIICIYVLVLFH